MSPLNFNQIKKSSDAAKNSGGGRQGDYGLSRKEFHAKKLKESKERQAKIDQDKAKRKLEKENRKKERESNKNTSENIKNNTPKDQKPKLSGKLTPIINTQAKKLAKRIVPILLAIVGKLIADELNKCPPAIVTQATLDTLNNIIKDLNKTTKEIDKIAKTANITATGANAILDAARIIKTVIPIVSLAAKPIPVIPGAIVVAIDDLDYLANSLLYNADGSERVAPIIAGINGLSVSIAMFSLILKQSAGIVASIIPLLQRCIGDNTSTQLSTPQLRSSAAFPPPIEDQTDQFLEDQFLEDQDLNNQNLDDQSLNQLLTTLNESPEQLSNISGQSIEPFSDITLQYIEYGTANYNNYEETSYNGFDIKIVEVPFTSTVVRKKAVGYSPSGIALIQTELSFTTNNQTLVSELKLIIDRDDLKAY
jgi:hypothetical protein